MKRTSLLCNEHTVMISNKNLKPGRLTNNTFQQSYIRRKLQYLLK